MQHLFLILFIVACTQAPLKKDEELVSVNAAINHAQASYLKGCVDAYHQLKIPLAFPQCRDKAIIHRQEIESTMGLD
jgi:hypothetical protein